MRVLCLVASLLMAAAAASATVTPLPGSTPQSAVVNTPFLNQIAVVVTDANGAPVPFANVGFSYQYAFFGVVIDADTYAFDCSPDLGWNCRMTADAQGVAILPGMYGTYGYRSVVYVGASSGAVSLGNTTIELDVGGYSPQARFKSLQDMWWSGVAENGWGMSVVEHGAQLFSVIYAYDAQGNPTWWVMPTGTWSADFLSTYQGNLYSPRSSSYFAYDTSRFAAGAPAGGAELTFSGPDSASLGLTIGGVGMRKQIQRMTDIGADSTNSQRSVGDMWWGGPSQNGWGVSIIERNGVLFAVWLTYDADGKPTWFVMPGGTWSASGTAYSGPLIRTHGAAWVGTGYDVSKFSAAATGTYTLRFANVHNATLEYSIDGRSGSVALMRQAF